jgi:hypothetical protein
MGERLAAYGGRVEIDTRPGEGFTLTLFLPVGRGTERAPPVQPSVAAIPPQPQVTA